MFVFFGYIYTPDTILFNRPPLIISSVIGGRVKTLYCVKAKKI